MNADQVSGLPAAAWVTSSYSDGDGGECVEMSHALAGAGVVPVRDSKSPAHILRFGTRGWSSFVDAVKEGEWVTSSYSDGDGGQCVEVSRSFAGAGVVPVRDSKVPAGVLVFRAGGWSSFVDAVKGGEWAASSYSGGDGGQCVEVSRSFAGAGVVPVRDSKVPGGVLVFRAGGWSSFVDAVKQGGPLA